MDVIGGCFYIEGGGGVGEVGDVGGEGGGKRGGGRGGGRVWKKVGIICVKHREGARLGVPD